MSVYRHHLEQFAHPNTPLHSNDKHPSKHIGIGSNIQISSKLHHIRHLSSVLTPPRTSPCPAPILSHRYQLTIPDYAPFHSIIQHVTAQRCFESRHSARNMSPSNVYHFFIDTKTDTSLIQTMQPLVDGTVLYSNPKHSISFHSRRYAVNPRSGSVCVHSSWMSHLNPTGRFCIFSSEWLRSIIKKSRKVHTESDLRVDGETANVERDGFWSCCGAQ